MTLKASTLRPGLLVSLKTSIHGNVRYEKKVLDAAHETTGGAEKARWETTRIIDDPKEHDAARKARSSAADAVRKVCAHSAFGLLCPEANAKELEAAIAEARKIASAFNEGATLSRVSVYVITGRVAPDDVEAVKAINSEVRDLLETMSTGISNLDVKAVRDAASRARELGSMLSSDAEARVRIAIETAREAARKIVKAGEAAAKEVDQVAIRKIVEQRTAFLDLDGSDEVKAPAAEGRAMDLAPEEQRRAQDGYQPEGRELDVGGSQS